MKRILSYLFIAVLFVLIAQGGTSSALLLPEKQHKKVNVLVDEILSKIHYKKVNIDGQFAESVFDSYLEKLDLNKMYFLEPDVQSFQKFRDNFESYIESGNQYAAYDMFNVYIRRLKERVDYIFKELEHDFDFSKDEYYVYDREKAQYAKTKEELDDLWRRRLKFDALNLKLAGKDPADIKDLLKKRYVRLQKMSVQYNSEDVFSLYMNAITETVDPHTNYFSPKKSEDFNIQMKLSLEGIGALLGQGNEYINVVNIVPGGPADKSKLLKENDKITGVGQGKTGEMVDVVGWRVDDAVQLIRGKKESYVRLEIIPSNADPSEPRKIITLLRDEVKLEDQASKSSILEVEEGGKKVKLGVIDVPQFYSDFEAQRRGDKDYRSVTRDVKRLIGELQKENVSGIIIDLRRNGGGSLQEAVDMTGLFIKDGPVVQVKDYTGRIEVDKDLDGEVFYDGPLAVLVDNNSASASEIFSAAIQDYQRGVIIGNQTFGKGTVQSLLGLDRYFPRDDTPLGQLKITVQKFYRINGGSTQHQGVMPDVNYPVAESFQDFRESARPHALPYDEIPKADYKIENSIKKYIPTLIQKHAQRMKSDLDFQFLQEDMNEIDEDSQQIKVSLNEEIRKRERDEKEAQKLERINKKRMAKGLKPLKKGEKDPDADDKNDYKLKEAGKILSDLISMIG